MAINSLTEITVVGCFVRGKERLKRNYKDPNHRLASLNGSAYSDSLYNEGDSNSIVRIAVLDTLRN